MRAHPPFLAPDGDRRKSSGSSGVAGTVPRVLVTDLRHFLDLPANAPGPARRLAEHLGDVVRAATAGDVGVTWMSALSCRRRPARRPCPGRMIVFRSQAPASIRWRCGVCDDGGLISNWEGSPYDLRRRRLGLVGTVNELVISDQAAAALRQLRLLDPEGERLVFRMRAHRAGAVLLAADGELEELIGFVAAEANHEPNRRRRGRLGYALDALRNLTPRPPDTV